MKLHVVFVFLLVSLITAAALLLVPGEDDLGQMYFRDKQYAEAEAALEAQLAEGNWTSFVVTPLVKLHLQAGDVDAAIAVMERYTDRRPRDVAALERLATYYRYAQRYTDFRLTLERVRAIDSTPPLLRTLSALYNRAGRLDAQVDAMAELVARGWATKQEALGLSYIQVALGRFDAAVETLDRLARLSPRAVNADVTNLRVFALAAGGDTAVAARTARAWIAGGGTLKTAMQHAIYLEQFGRPDLALDVLARFDALAGVSPDLLSQVARLLRATGAPEAARLRLTRLYDQGRLEPWMVETLMDLALTTGHLDQALSILAGAAPPALIPDWMVASLIEKALLDGRPAFLERLLAHLDAADLEPVPLLAARLMHAVGRPAMARQWAMTAHAHWRDLSGDQQLALASLLGAIGDDAASLAMFRQVAAQPSPPPDVWPGLSWAYVRQGRVAEGLADFRQRGAATGADPDMTLGWLVLAVNAGRTDVVADWVQSDAFGRLDVATLERIRTLGGEAGSWRLHLAAGERLVAVRDSPEDRAELTVAMAMAAVTRPDLAALRPFILARPDTAAGLAALADPAPRLAATLARTLGVAVPAPAARGLSPEAREAVAAAEAAVLGDPSAAAEAAAAVLGGLRPLLPNAEPALAAAYASAVVVATRADQPPAVVARRTAERRVAADDPARAEQWLATLARLGGLETAAPRLERLARREPDRWLYPYLEILAELGRSEEITRFLLAELERPDLSTEQREARLYALLDKGDPAAAGSRLRDMAVRQGPPWSDIYAEQLRRSGQTQALARFWRARAARPDLGAPERAQLAYKLLEIGDKAAAEPLFRRLAEGAPPTADAVSNLLYLWGPRPRADELAWLEQRARAAGADDLGGWLAHLVDRGAAGRALALLDDRPDALADPAVLDVAVRAAERDGDGMALRRFLALSLDPSQPVALDADALLGHARIALWRGLPRLAQAGFQTVLNRRPNDAEALAGLGKAAYAAEDWRAAQAALGQVMRGGGADWESTLYYADVLRRSGGERAARAYDARALAALDRVEDGDSLAIQRTRAMLLARLGRTEEAERLYTRLIALHPGDVTLRTAYANSLLDRGEIARAEAVLDGPRLRTSQVAR
ncbi:tetratricopeptide repeat protein [Roseospira goensis]|uniref:Tetratricopeptide (TPR) repeat protein n=1 Tax=Roseospira goensis TaxID=391922 RepID=A0A7W6S0I9_9PROT|nr:tetratricopeptide repeat protein [Roseospira goensis]MBB4285987.1 tetratricopeptide (TPR) repeat protein [Roseospira goensis]